MRQRAGRGEQAEQHRVRRQGDHVGQPPGAPVDDGERHAGDREVEPGGEQPAGHPGEPPGDRAADRGGGGLHGGRPGGHRDRARDRAQRAGAAGPAMPSAPAPRSGPAAVPAGDPDVPAREQAVAGGRRGTVPAARATRGRAAAGVGRERSSDSRLRRLRHRGRRCSGLAPTVRDRRYLRSQRNLRRRGVDRATTASGMPWMRPGPGRGARRARRARAAAPPSIGNGTGPATSITTAAASSCTGGVADLGGPRPGSAGRRAASGAAPRAR